MIRSLIVALALMVQPVHAQEVVQVPPRCMGTLKPDARIYEVIQTGAARGTHIDVTREPEAKNAERGPVQVMAISHNRNGDTWVVRKDDFFEYRIEDTNLIGPCKLLPFMQLD